MVNWKKCYKDESVIQKVNLLKSHTYLTMADQSFIFQIITAVIGIGGLVTAIITYYWSQLTRRKEALFPLIDKFDDCESLIIAKNILDDFSVTEELDKARGNGWNKPINRWMEQTY